MLPLLQTIEFELRKLEAQQALEHINYLKSFMPNSFLATGGWFDVHNTCVQIHICLTEWICVQQINITVII